MLIAFYKPYGVLSQFTKEHETHRTLAEFNFPKKVYPIGRLDNDSEGLILLSDEAHWNQSLLHPDRAHQRTYHVQVEGIPSSEALSRLQRGVRIGDYQTLPCKAQIMEPQPTYAARTSPIRERKSIPTCWLTMTLIEGKNRQVRRMTAAISHPTLRLIRASIGQFELSRSNLEIGTWRELNETEKKLILSKS